MNIKFKDYIASIKTLRLDKYMSIILINLVLVICFNISTSQFIKAKKDSYISLNKQYDLLQQFSKDELNFIKNHPLTIPSSGDDFEKYLRENINKYYGRLETIDKASNDYKLIKTFSISLAFWHDKFLFQFLKKLYNYSNGYIRIMELNIERSEAMLLTDPGLHVNIVCNLYQKH